MTILNWFKESEAKLTIGEIAFEILVTISDTTERDPAKDKAEFKKSTARAVVWFVDDCRFHNYRLWNKHTTKETKLQDFMTKLVLSDEIHKITHEGLNANRINSCRVMRAEKEYQKHIIIVSFDMDIYKDLPEKQKAREDKALKDAKNADTTQKATAAKASQAQSEQLESNALFESINNWLRTKLWE